MTVVEKLNVLKSLEPVLAARGVTGLSVFGSQIDGRSGPDSDIDIIVDYDPDSRFSLLDLLIPFRAPYRPLWTGLGSLALYLSVALIASFYLRAVVSRRVWRAFHYVTYLAFLLALVHGLMAGTDTAQPAVYWRYVATGATLLFATIYRVLTARHSHKPAPRSAGRHAPAPVPE